MRKALVLSLSFLLYGCGATVKNFIKSGTETYPPKPEGYDVLVFFEGDHPTEDFKVIGMVYAEREADTKVRWDVVKPEEIIRLLKDEARQNGADAIIDLKITSADHKGRDWKRGEAKAIIFK